MGALLERAHLGLAGNLTFCSGCGFARALLRYDAQGKLVETLYLGPDDRPRNGKEGWARKRVTQLAPGTPPREEFWKAGADGKLVPIPPRK